MTLSRVDGISVVQATIAELDEEIDRERAPDVVVSSTSSSRAPAPHDPRPQAGHDAGNAHREDAAPMKDQQIRLKAVYELRVDE